MALWTVPVPAGSLPSGWTSSAVGASYAGAGATYANSVFTVAGTGDQMWNTSDSFEFVYTPLAGDGWVVARITGVQNARYFSRYGVMQGPTPAGTYAFLGITGPGSNPDFQWRTGTGQGTSQATAAAVVTLPYWVKLARAGDVMTAYGSADGVCRVGGHCL
ncbi:MAG: hypothetical protein IT167_12715 [Bryobacterales bacterium]|nr:hypothetical protein [Bryobacterales bacterium]